MRPRFPALTFLFVCLAIAGLAVSEPGGNQYQLSTTEPFTLLGCASIPDAGQAGYETEHLTHWPCKYISYRAWLQGVETIGQCSPIEEHLLEHGS